MLSNRGFRAAVTPWLCFLALFPVLSVDVMARLFANLDYQDRGNVALIAFFESTRMLRSVIVLALVGLLLGRRIARREVRALVLFLLFGGLAYAMVFGGGPYVGPFQEWLTLRLVALGLSREVIRTIFAFAWWPAWLALAALLRFAVLFPKPFEIGSIHESGRDDRAGLMRGVPGAGFDVGAATRAALHNAAQRGWLNAGPVWIACAAFAAVSIALQNHAALQLLWIPLLFGAGLAIASLRAGYVAGDEMEQRQVRTLGKGAFAGVLLFLVATVAGMFGDGPVTAVTVYLLLTLAPATFVGAIATAVLTDTPDRVAARISAAG